MSLAILNNSRPAATARGSASAQRAVRAGGASRIRGSGRVSKSDLLVITTQLSIMCRTGVDLAAALTSVAHDCRHPGLQRILTAVSADVNAGAPASVALARHEAVFGAAYIASIAAAEASGTLTDVLQRLCELLKNEIRMRNTIRSIIAYPIVLISVAMVVVTALVFFVLPQFSKVFENMSRPAPVTTKMLLDAALFLRTHVLWFAGAVAVVGVGLFQVSRTESSRRYIDWLMLNAPGLREATRSLLSGRSFRLLGTLLESGVPLLDALRLSRSATKNRLFLEMFDGIEREVVNGRGMSGEVARSEFVPSGAAQMILTAERSGRLGDVLQLIGQHYEDEGEQLIRSSMKIVEPAVIVMMGIVVGGIVLTVMLPLLDVTTAGN